MEGKTFERATFYYSNKYPATIGIFINLLKSLAKKYDMKIHVTRGVLNIIRGDRFSPFYPKAEFMDIEILRVEDKDVIRVCLSKLWGGSGEFNNSEALVLLSMQCFIEGVIVHIPKHIGYFTNNIMRSSAPIQEVIKSANGEDVVCIMSLRNSSYPTDFVNSEGTVMTSNILIVKKDAIEETLGGDINEILDTIQEIDPRKGYINPIDRITIRSKQIKINDLCQSTDISPMVLRKVLNALNILPCKLQENLFHEDSIYVYIKPSTEELESSTLDNMISHYILEIPWMKIGKLKYYRIIKENLTFKIEEL